MVSPTTRIYLKKIKRPRKGKPDRYVWALRWIDSNSLERFKTLGDVTRITKREATAILRRHQSEMDAGRIPKDKPQEMTIGQFAMYHRQAMDGTMKPSTLAVQRVAIEHLIAALGPNRMLHQLCAADVGALRRYLRQRGVSLATMRKNILTLKAMFRRAKRWKLLLDNPFDGEPVPKVQAKRMRIFQPEEIDAMIDVAPTQWWKTFIRLGVTSGLRLQELLHLHWADVDWRRKTVSVTAKRASTFRAGDREYPILDWSAKSHEERVVPIPDVALDALDGLRENSDASHYVFLSLERLTLLNERLHAGRLHGRYEACNNMMREFGVIQKHAAQRRNASDWQTGTIHDLRRTFGTRLAEVVPMTTLQKWMGHASITTTAQFYVAVLDHHADQARSALGA